MNKKPVSIFSKQLVDEKHTLEKQGRSNYSIVIMCLALSLLAGTVLPAAGEMRVFRPYTAVVQSGLPDLLLRASAAPVSLPSVSPPPVDSSLVTITVQNRLTLVRGLFSVETRPPVFGSEAHGVEVSVDLPTWLAQIGNINAGGGFQCVVAVSPVSPMHQTVFCFNGTIPAGESVNILIDVRSVRQDPCFGAWLDIWAHVDPFLQISEADENNNAASTAILLSGPCCSGLNISIKPTDNLEEGIVKTINAEITSDCGINYVQAFSKKNTELSWRTSSLPTQSGNLFSYDIPTSENFVGGDTYDFRWDVKYDNECKSESVFGSRCETVPLTTYTATSQFTVPECVPGISSELPVPLIPQQTNFWCWAASGQMIMEYLGTTNDVRQCTQANNEFSRTDCCQGGGSACGILFPYALYHKACIKAGWPEFNKYGFTSSETRYRANLALSWDELKKQLSTASNCKGAPVAFSWSWVGKSYGHMMVARGYEDDSAGKHWVYINDPSLPCIGDARLIPYDEYVERPGDHTHSGDIYNIRRQTP